MSFRDANLSPSGREVLRAPDSFRMQLLQDLALSLGGVAAMDVHPLLVHNRQHRIYDIGGIPSAARKSVLSRCLRLHTATQSAFSFFISAKG